EDAEGQREIGFGLEVFDGLGLAVLEQVEVILGEAGDQRAMLVFDVEEQLDDFDVDLQGLDGLVLRLAVGAGRGGARRSRRILRGCGKRQGHGQSEKTRDQARFAMYFRHQRFYPETLLVYPVRTCNG